MPKKKKQIKIGNEEKGGLREEQEGKIEKTIHHEAQIPSTPN